MRPALALLVAALLALAVPAAASAQCGCVRFASAFVKNRGHAQAVYNREAASRGVDARLRRRVRNGVYDWQRERSFRPGLCARHPEVCRAATACLIAGGAAYANARLDGASVGRSARSGAVACAAAVAATILVA